MKRQRVTSSVIASVGYDAARQTLEVEFHSGDVYRYRDVPEFHAAGLLRADSKGRFLNEQIKPRYTFVEVHRDG